MNKLKAKELSEQEQIEFAKEALATRLKKKSFQMLLATKS
jgi:hypothetical protein